MKPITGFPILPDIDDMLQSLLLVEEGEHEFSSEDEGVQDLRQLFFPVTRNSIYLNHASQGPFARPVAQALHEYVNDISQFGGANHERWMHYEWGVHRRLANFIGAQTHQIALTASTGDGFMHIAQGLDWSAGDNIVSAHGEFPTNIYPWLNLREYGVQLRLVEPREHRILPEDIFASINEKTRLVSLGLVEFSTGYRNDIATITRYCHERGILCGVDTMQALGALDIDVQTLGVDFMAAAAHKWLLGPTMCGILYVNDDLLARLKTRRRGWKSIENPFDFFNYEQPLKAGAARFEHSTPNMLPIVGLDAALGLFESIDGGMQAVEERILGLTAYAISGLERLGYPVVSPQGEGERSGIICFSPHPEHPNLTVPRLVDMLAVRNIHLAARGSVARLSPHFYNVPEEIDAMFNILEELKQPLPETQGRK